jgi:hypothetical protein
MRVALWSLALVSVLSGIALEFIGGRLRDRWGPPLFIGGVVLGGWLGITTP